MHEKIISNSLLAGAPLPVPGEGGGFETALDTARQENEPETPYEILNSPELRIKYVRMTDELIRTMVKEDTDVAIFLDKSARPVAWLVQALWDQLAPPTKDDGSPCKKPEIKFLNIDREQWGAVTGRTEEGVIDIDNIPAERINELRRVFSPVGVKLGEDEFYDGPSMFADQQLMVIDEVSVSGDTLQMSRNIISKAFPDAKEVTGHYWMAGRVRQDPRSGVRRNTDLPVWYSDRESTGRLVADRDTSKSLQSASQRQRIGRYWLSTRFREADAKGIQLHREVKQIAKDLAEHRIIYTPSPLWGKGLDSVERRILRINGITLKQFVELRKATGNDYEKLQRDFNELREAASQQPE